MSDTGLHVPGIIACLQHAYLRHVTLAVLPRATAIELAGF